MTREYQAHPAAEMFPLLEGAEFDALVTDIREHGLREPITLHDGMVLDGRNRYRACHELSIEPATEPWDADGTPEAFVISKNLHRRHLNESQRAMIAARLATLRKGDVASQVSGDQIRPPSITEAADLLNVGKSTVIQAKKVLRDGEPQDIAAVDSGEAAASTVAEQIRKGVPKEERRTRRDAPLSQIGKNPERIQRQQINAEIWGRVKDALTHLTSLPLPSDVVAIVRANDKTGLVDARLSQSLQWLKDFENEWSNGRQDAA